MSLETLDVEGPPGSEPQVNDIALSALFGVESVADVREIGASLDDAFGKEEPGCELEIVAGRSHRHTHGCVIQPNFQGFFSHHVVELVALATGVPLNNGCRLQRMVHKCKRPLEIEDLQREFVLRRKDLRVDTRVRHLDVRVVSRPPVTDANGSAQLVSSVRADDVAMRDLRERRGIIHPALIRHNGSW
jgi:hypothetical protein